MKDPSYTVHTGNPTHDLWPLLRQTATLLDDCMDGPCRKAGLSVEAFGLLHMVRHASVPMTAYKLSKVLGQRHNSTAQTVRRLIGKGLLRRNDSEGKSSIEITEEGTRCVLEITAAASTNPAVANLTSEEASQIRHALAILRSAALKELGKMDMGDMHFSYDRGTPVRHHEVTSITFDGPHVSQPNPLDFRPTTHP